MQKVRCHTHRSKCDDLFVAAASRAPHVLICTLRRTRWRRLDLIAFSCGGTKHKDDLFVAAASCAPHVLICTLRRTR
jgi:hypothetical protein